MSKKPIGDKLAVSECREGGLIQKFRLTIPFGCVEISCCSKGVHTFLFDQVFREKSAHNSFKVKINNSFEKPNAIELFECNDLAPISNAPLDECLNYLRYYFFKFDKSLSVLEQRIPAPKLPSICWTSICSARHSFTLNVLKALIDNVAIGERVSYKELSKLVGKENAQRAVGSVMRRNPIALIIPCHRVIKSNQLLGNYTGGVEIKKWLLDYEKCEFKRRQNE